MQHKSSCTAENIRTFFSQMKRKLGNKYVILQKDEENSISEGNNLNNEKVLRKTEINNGHIIKSKTY